MATDVIMPALGMAQETGRVIKWHKAEGEAVQAGEPLLEVETDKVTVELETPASGVLGSVSALAGDDVPVGRVIARILAPGEEAGPEPSPEPVAAAAAPVAITVSPITASRASERDGGRVLASPKARRIAADHGVDIAVVRGSGKYGAVLAADVVAVVETGVAEPAAASPKPGRTWQLMAERTARAWATVPHFYLEREVDAGRLISWRDAASRRLDVELTYSDLLVKVAAAALREHPRVNAQWRDGSIVLLEDVNVGLAVALEEGLVVPVIQRADRLGLPAIADRRRELVSRARSGQLRPEDVQGGTFTISNLGMFGVDAFQAIVNAPQAAILAVGRIVERIVPVDGAPAVRPRLTLTLSCDHRALDGAAGARYLETVADLLEEPAALAS